jgi:hypothetical protein
VCVRVLVEPESCGGLGLRTVGGSGRSMYCVWFAHENDKLGILC